jgi:hypothetical protein
LELQRRQRRALLGTEAVARGAIGLAGDDRLAGPALDVVVAEAGVPPATFDR